MKEIGKDGKNYFECEECGLLYEEKSWASKCEEWCSKYSSCNLEIIKHALKDKQKT